MPENEYPEIEIESQPEPPKRRIAHVLTDENVKEALTRARGVYRYAAEMLGVARSSVHRYTRTRPALLEHREECRNNQVDRSEIELYKQIEKGNIRAIIFHLSTQGRDRGYGDVRQIVGAEGGPIQVEVKQAPSALDNLDPRRLMPAELALLRELFLRNRDNPQLLSEGDHGELLRLLDKGSRPVLTIDAVATEIKNG